MFAMFREGMFSFLELFLQRLIECEDFNPHTHDVEVENVLRDDGEVEERFLVVRY
jgi:Asp-tRNA(Asn)/Glu-tRNA(Gln) amidotransferase C subunit